MSRARDDCGRGESWGPPFAGYVGRAGDAASRQQYRAVEIMFSRIHVAPFKGHSTWRRRRALSDCRSDDGMSKTEIRT